MQKDMVLTVHICPGYLRGDWRTGVSQIHSTQSEKNAEFIDWGHAKKSTMVMVTLSVGFRSCVITMRYRV